MPGPSSQAFFSAPRLRTSSTRRRKLSSAEQIFRYAPLSSGLDIVRKTLGQHEYRHRASNRHPGLAKTDQTT